MKSAARVALLLAALAVAACAPSPGSIQPQYVSAIPYGNWSCSQLGQEEQQLAIALATASKEQSQARSNDIAGVLFPGLPVASMSGGDIAPQIALIKGEQEAVHEAVIYEFCQSWYPLFFAGES